MFHESNEGKLIHHFEIDNVQLLAALQL